jgi:coronin-7
LVYKLNSKNSIDGSSWSNNGNILATGHADKFFRLWDVRAENSLIKEVEAMSSVKPYGIEYVDKTQCIFTIGFSKSGNREFTLWDTRDLSKEICRIGKINKINLRLGIW